MEYYVRSDLLMMTYDRRDDLDRVRHRDLVWIRRRSVNIIRQRGVVYQNNLPRSGPNGERGEYYQQCLFWKHKSEIHTSPRLMVPRDWNNLEQSTRNAQDWNNLEQSTRTAQERHPKQHLPRRCCSDPWLHKNDMSKPQSPVLAAAA